MTSDLHALVIDDEPQVTGLVAQVLAAEGWTVREAHNAEQAIHKLSERDWSLVFCDVVLGGTDGYEVLRQFTLEQPKARFVLMTGQASAAGALDATSIGAHDYLVKPFTIDEIIEISKEALEQYGNRGPTPKKKGSRPAGYTSDLPLVGNSPKFIECLKLVGRVAVTKLPVLITGESGTGKEVVARAIHRRSPRADGEFVTVNCGAIPSDLIESELFGHSKGSFTGADRERVGLWEMATGGTLFLDEITETSPLFQVKILRSLQEGEIRRVGSNRTVKVDVRVIAASNRDIEVEVREERFRQDLMYRLNAVTIELPPLRDRVEDIQLLAEYFAKRVRPEPIKFSPKAIERLNSYQWPGNIRELENAVLHAVSLSDGIVYPQHLPARILESVDAGATSDDIVSEIIGPHTKLPIDQLPTLSALEERYVEQVLEQMEGNKQAAARVLGIDRKTLTRIVKRGAERSTGI